MLKMFFILLFSIYLYAEKGNTLKFPNGSITDFTFQTDLNKQQETLKDMILVEIAKQSYLTRRNKNIFNCERDSLGTYYCPSNLAKASKFFDYENGIAQKKHRTIITNPNCNGTMANGVCYEQVGNATKVTNLSCRNISVPCGPGAKSCCHIDFSCNDNKVTIKYHDCCNPTGSLKATITIDDPNDFLNGVKYQYCGDAKIICDRNGTCSIYFQDYSCKKCSLKGSPFLSNTFSLNTKTEYICNDNQYIGKNTYQGADPTKCYNGYNPSCSQGSLNKKTNKCELDYTYYNYLCSNSKNEQNFNFVPQETGGDCNGRNLLSNGSCNLSNPPINNCKREKFMCDANFHPSIKPVFINNEWKCSPFACDRENRCGYGTCDAPTIASKDKYQDAAYNPLKYTTNNRCNSAFCGYVLNKQVSYCENKRCPKGENIIEKDGKCYKLECPAGTFISGDKCIKSNF